MPDKYYLSEGSHVEVRVEEEGLENSWFPATVIESPEPSEYPTPTRRTKVNKTAKVQYKHMLSDDTGELLVETIVASSIRPAPPEDPEPLGPVEPYEVVDAFDKDVWWTGYVVRCDVDDDDDVYVVACKNPPDVLRVRRVDLRLHWDWVHSPTRWVRPQKEKYKKGVPWFFTPATEIEQDYNGKQPGTTWKPAIYVGKSRHGLSFIKFSYEGNCVEALSGRIRPRQPESKRKHFELTETVEAFCDPLWTVGVVVRVLQGKRYVVFLELEKKEAEFHRSQLRSRLDWANGRWVSKSSSMTPKSGRKLKHARDLEKIIAIADDARPLKKALVFEYRGASPKKRTVIRDDNELPKECIVVIDCDESLNDDEKEPVKGVAIRSDEQSKEKDDELVAESLAIVEHDGSKQVAVGDEAESPASVNKSGVSESMPFVKCSSIWRYFEEEAVFKRFPQSPNFLALGKCGEDEREGISVSYMVNFSNLVQRISNLQQNCTRECVESMKEKLLEYEHVGFEVNEIRGILDEWLGKDMEWEGNECLIREKTCGTVVVEEELKMTKEKRAILMEELNKLRESEAILTKELNKLRESEATLMEERERLGSEIAGLKEEADSVLESRRELLNFFPSFADGKLG